MKISFKNWVILFAIILNIFCIVKAEWDCDIAQPELDLEIAVQNVKDYLNNDNLVLDEQDVLQALRNLKNYCCKLQDWCEEGESNWKLPQSPFLFDQLIDVGFRKIDAFEDDLYQWVQPDEQGKERRDFIGETAKDDKWSAPWYIIQKFQEYWKIGWWDILICSPNYEWVSCRYQKACEDAQKITDYYLKLSTDKSFWDRYWDYKNLACSDIVSKRINREYNYIQKIIIDESIEFMSDNIHSYAVKYFTEDSLINWLFEKFANLQWYISQVFSKVGNGTFNCSP